MNAPSAAAEAVHDQESLPIRGFRGTPEEIERQWYEKVYTGRGDRMAQLTWRDVLMGGALGGVLSLTKLYIGLTAGWGFGVAITACILSYAIWSALHRARIARTPMTILANNCMQSTASSAGSATGGPLLSAFAADLVDVVDADSPSLLGVPERAQLPFPLIVETAQALLRAGLLREGL